MVLLKFSCQNFLLFGSFFRKKKLLTRAPNKTSQLLRMYIVTCIYVSKGFLNSAIFPHQGAIQAKYDAIDKDTPIPTDRQVRPAVLSNIVTLNNAKVFSTSHSHLPITADVADNTRRVSPSSNLIHGMARTLQTDRNQQLNCNKWKVKSSFTSGSLFLQQEKQSVVKNITDVLLKVLLLSNICCACWILYQRVLSTLRSCKVSRASQKWVPEQRDSPRSLARSKKTSQATAVPFGWVKKYFPLGTMFRKL